MLRHGRCSRPPKADCELRAVPRRGARNPRAMASNAHAAVAVTPDDDVVAHPPESAVAPPAGEAHTFVATSHVAPLMQSAELADVCKHVPSPPHLYGAHL